MSKVPLLVQQAHIMTLNSLSFADRSKIFLAQQISRYYRTFPQTLENWEPEVFKSYKFGHPIPSSRAIPRIIWTYWDSPEPPFIIRQCFRNWKKFNPDFELNILNQNTLKDVLPNTPENLAKHPHAKQSDWIRFALLHLYGGIWIDASTILTSSLEWVIKEQQHTGNEFIGYYLDKFTKDTNFPVVESWFLAAPPASPFISDVLQEFTTHALAHSGEDYVSYLKSLGNFESLKQGIYDPSYLNIHLSMQYVLHTNRNYQLSLGKAEQGPFYYHALSHWNRDRLRIKLLCCKVSRTPPPLVKLRKSDRKGTDMYIEHGAYLPGSLIDTYLLNI